MLEDGHRGAIDAMYKDWPFFKVTFDMIAMVLAKADDATVQLYEAKLVDPSLHPMGERLRESFRRTREAVLSIVGAESVLGSGALLSAVACLPSALLCWLTSCTPRLAVVGCEPFWAGRSVAATSQHDYTPGFRAASPVVHGADGGKRAGERNRNTAELANKLRLRAPYVAPLNVLQALAMAAIRQQSADGVAAAASSEASTHSDVNANSETWALLNREPEAVPNKDLLIITIKGIAAGMQNTG